MANNMDQDQLRELGDRDKIKNELVKEFTQHLVTGEMNDDSVVRVKLVVLGPLNSGKTCWVTRVISEKFNAAETPTVGAKYSSQGVAIDEKEYQFEIWDVSGEEWCRGLCPMYLQHAHAAIVCYDQSDMESYKQAKVWIEYAKKQGDRDLLIALVGTKYDLIDEVKTEPIDPKEVENFFVNEQNLEGAFFFPKVSSKTGENAQDVILTIAETFHERGVKKQRNSVMDADVEFSTILGKGNENKDILSPQEANEVGQVENADKCKSKFEKFSISMKKGSLACFDQSKRTAAKTYETTKIKSIAVAENIHRSSRHFKDNFHLRSRKLIRKMKSSNMQEVTTVPGSTASDQNGQHQSELNDPTV